MDVYEEGELRLVKAGPLGDFGNNAYLIQDRDSGEAIIVDAPADGAALIARLCAGPTNAGWRGRVIEEQLSLAQYSDFFSRLPDAVRDQVLARWGPPEADELIVPRTWHLR